jgi:putative DNA primase/helicase
VTPPTWLPVMAEQLPPQITRSERCVLSKGVVRDGKVTKERLQIADPSRLASVDDPATWGRFDDALDAYSIGGVDGIGYVLAADDPLSGIDLDKCRDPESGVISPWAMDIVRRTKSYTEISPSGTGLRIFLYGYLPPTGRRKGLVELYDDGRYLTVTGHHLEGTPRRIEVRIEELHALHAEIFGPPSPAAATARPVEPVDLDDLTLLDRARHARNADKFTRLWNGDTTDYPSPSEAELALCQHLAFWTGRDGARMDRLFRQSGLMRSKWDSRRGVTTYGAMTIATACERTRDTYSSGNGSAPRAGASSTAPSTPPTATGAEDGPLVIGLGRFLAEAKKLPPRETYIKGILSDDGGGWIAGEEKVGKSWWAEEEALCLSLGLDVCRRFVVPARRRVLFLQEEDSPRRTNGRIRALLRGHGLDPEDQALGEELDAWFRIEVWAGFTFDDPAMVARLEAAIIEFRPAIAYIDVLRKVTIKDLNKADQVSQLLAVLDRLRREYGVLFRVLHHFRKVQGFRAGRGSQEIGGSFVLGAWAENSLFFEPVGRKQGIVRVEVQSKDGAPVPAFRLRIEAEGPRSAPDIVRLVAEDEKAAEDVDDVILQALTTLPKTEAVAGKPGVSVQTLLEALKKSDKTVRWALNRLVDGGRCLVTGKASKQKTLYGVKEQ